MKLVRIVQDLITLKIKPLSAIGCEVHNFTPEKIDCQGENLTPTIPTIAGFVPSDPIRYNQLIGELATLKRELTCARSHFDFQTEFDLIDADIFYINGLETKYNYLIKQIKAS